MRNERERLSSAEEIDLIELVQGVWRQKLWVGGVSALSVVIGLAYAMLVSPIYQAKLFVQPPSQSDVGVLNYGRGGDTGLPTYTVKNVYEVYLRALNSEAVRNQFFRTVYQAALHESDRSASRDVLYSQFSSKMMIEQASKDDLSRFVIVANAEDPALAAQWVAEYAQMAADFAKREVVSANESDMLIKADNLAWEIDSAQASARKQRQDQIAQLEEALKVAKSIGLEKPPIISGNLSAEVSAGMSGSLNYMRGSKALEAEIANLESRPSDAPFIRGLRANQEKLSFYRGLKVEPQAFAVFRPDGAVEQPDKPIKPRKALIVLFSLLVGLGLGLVGAVVREILLRRTITQAVQD